MAYIFKDKELYIRSFIRQMLTKISLIVNKCTHIGSSNKSHILLRTERQTFRFLPSSSAVAFLVRTLVTPMEDVINTSEEATKLIDALKFDVSQTDNSSKGEFRDELINILNKKFML